MSKLTEADFESFFKYAYIEPGTSAALVLANWEKKTNAYGREVLSFLVVARDGRGLTRPQFYETGSVSMVRGFMPLILEAESKGVDMLDVTIACRSPGRYEIVAGKVWEPQKVSAFPAGVSYGRQ